VTTILNLFCTLNLHHESCITSHDSLLMDPVINSFRDLFSPVPAMEKKDPNSQTFETLDGG